MSRLGRIPVKLPNNVKVRLDGTTLTVEGPKGKLIRKIPSGLELKTEGDKVVVNRTNDLKPTRAAHGMLRSLLNGMVKGVSDGFSKTLVSVGVGYRMALTGNKLNISAGLSHPVVFSLPTGVQGKVDDQTRLTLSGIDKELVGLIADRIRSVRPPEPYKGKGIRYDKEVIQLKEGKAAGKGAK